MRMSNNKDSDRTQPSEGNPRMAITNLIIQLHGRAGADAVAVEAGGQRIELDAQQRFSFDLTVPADATSFGITVIGADERRSTRWLQIRNRDNVVGVTG